MKAYPGSLTEQLIMCYVRQSTVNPTARLLSFVAVRKRAPFGDHPLPVDFSAFWQCLQMVVACPALVQAFPLFSALSPQWEAFLKRWPDLWAVAYSQKVTGNLLPYEEKERRYLEIVAECTPQVAEADHRLDSSVRRFGEPLVEWVEPERCFWCVNKAATIRHEIEIAKANKFFQPPRRWRTDQEGFETCACGYSLLRGLNPQATTQ